MYVQTMDRGTCHTLHAQLASRNWRNDDRACQHVRHARQCRWRVVKAIKVAKSCESFIVCRCVWSRYTIAMNALLIIAVALAVVAVSCEQENVVKERKKRGAYDSGAGGGYTEYGHYQQHHEHHYVKKSRSFIRMAVELVE